MGDVVFATIDDGAVIIPRTEDCADGATELFARIIGEIFACPFSDEFAESISKGAECGGIQFGVGDMGIFGMELFFKIFNDDFEGIVVFTGSLLDAHNDIAVHLEETAVAVVGKTFVTTAFGEGTYGLVVETEIEDGIHHTWHGVAGA